VARRPSEFVRPLSMDEGRKLQRIRRTPTNPVRMRRAMAVLMSTQGRKGDHPAMALAGPGGANVEHGIAPSGSERR
jgi:hypothetical protein